MKKVVSLIFALIMLFSCAIGASAEEFNGADLFTVDIPEGFEQTGEKVSSFTFTNKDGDSFTISYSDNTQEDSIFSPADMSKKEIEEYTNALSTEAESIMRTYADGFELEFLNSEKVKHNNGKTALVCQTKTTMKKGEKTGIFYQTMYEFGCKDYKYTFTYTTSDKNEKDSLGVAFESINISEPETATKLDALKDFAVASAVLLLILIGIIKFIRTPEKREKGKIK